MIVLPFAVVLALAGAWLWTPDKDRATLETQYLQSAGDMMDVAGTRLHVRDSGPKSAPAIVMLHGFGGSLQTWDAWIGGLAEDHRVVRLDLPGSGLSPPDATDDYTDQRSVALLIALLDGLGIARATLVGHSIGGRIAWTFAASHPERVDKLVLVAPDGFASPGFEYGKAPVVPGAVKLMRYVLPKPLVRRTLAKAYANPATMTDALAKRYYDLMLAPGSRAALIRRMEQTVRVDPRPSLRSIQAPVLLLWGMQDAMIPFSNAADYVAVLPRPTLEALPGVGHVPQEESPAASLALVRAFLK